MEHKLEELLKFIENTLATVFDKITGIHETHNLPPEAKAEIETAIVAAKGDMSTAAQNTIASVAQDNANIVAQAADKAATDAAAQVKADAETSGDAEESTADTAKKKK